MKRILGAAALSISLLATTPATAESVAHSAQAQTYAQQLVEIAVTSQFDGQHIDALMRTVMHSVPNATPEQADVIADLLSEEMKALQPKLEAFSKDLFLKYYTEQDLQAMLAFYDSPTGQKTLDIMPQLTQESALFTAQAMRGIIPKMVKRLREMPVPDMPTDDEKDAQ